MSAMTHTDPKEPVTSVRPDEPPPLSTLHKVLWVLLAIDLVVLATVWLTVPVVGIFPGSIAVILLAALGLTRVYERRKAAGHPR